MATTPAMKQNLGWVVALILLLIVLTVFWPLSISKQSKIDGCVSCHDQVQDMSASHPIEAFGCASCHLGNSLAMDEKNAHAGMVRNPSDLHWASETCGQNNCHPQLTDAVSKSIMTTNSGIISATLLQWHESELWEDSLQSIGNGFPDSSLATSHMRKLCAGCHVNKRENDFPGEFGMRGGGCNDCHLVPAENDNLHPVFTVQIGIATCEKCHNRSNRTALNYQGKFESEGYGTPFSQGNLSSDTLSGGRFFYHIPADVHFEAGMTCIDCHGLEDVMGDGKRHAHLETQVHIKCEDCHHLLLAKPAADERVYKVVASNSNLHLPLDSLFLKTKDGTFMANVIQVQGTPKLLLKGNGKLLDIPQNTQNVECDLKGHERLTCQSCHTAYTPQCYGCHDVYNPTRKQMDKVSMKETDGHWSEGRSYLRFENPPLLLDQLNRVMPAAPGCQVFLTDLRDSSQVYWPTMAAFDPHITRKKVPSCESCHSNPKRLGLGAGNLKIEDGKLIVDPVYDVQTAGLGSVPLETFVDDNGQALQRMSRQFERPFNKRELEKIVGVSLCIICHDSYQDGIYTNFKQSLSRYRIDQSLPCRD